MKKLFVCLIPLLLAGCAGSANHPVLTEFEASDHLIGCEGIQDELNKAQEVIDDVMQDKTDMTVQDVTDGLLWFPFNLIAKSSNYKSSLDAASKRIARLEALQKEKGCLYEYEEDNQSI